MPISFPVYSLSNITPFTYRDGYTYLEVLEAFRSWLNEDVVPQLNDNAATLILNYSAALEAISGSAAATVAELQALFDTFVVELTDATMGERITDSASASNAAIEALINAHPFISASAVAEGYASKANLTDLANTLETDYISNVTVELDYASKEYAKKFANSDEHETNVSRFGAIGDGVADDTAALNAAVNAGVPLYWGGVKKIYRITAGVIANLTASMVWRSSGASIIVDSPVSIKEAVYVNAQGFSVSIVGPLTVNGNRKAFTGYYFYNNGAFADFNGVGLKAKNMFRANATIIGGDGIHVRGAFTTVNIERADIRSITMAANAGVSGSQGVSGITVSSAGVGLAPREVNIIAPYIDGVYSEDVTYQMDQDGIRVFTEEDSGSVLLFETHFNITGGMIRNCGGRSIKSQCEFGVITGVKLYRDSTYLGTGMRAMPDIDFQVGGGTIRDIELQYKQAVPAKVVQWSGTRQVGGKYALGLTIDGIKGSINGGSTSVFTNVIALAMAEQLKAVHNFSNIQLTNLSNGISGDVVTISGLVTAEAIIRLNNVSVPCQDTSKVVYRSGVAMPTFVSINNFANDRYQTVAMSGSAVAGAFTVVASGQNIRVA